MEPATEPGQSQKAAKILDLEIGLRVPRNQDGARKLSKSWITGSALCAMDVNRRQPPGGEFEGGVVKDY